MVKLWCGDFIWNTQLDEITRTAGLPIKRGQGLFVQFIVLGRQSVRHAKPTLSESIARLHNHNKHNMSPAIRLEWPRSATFLALFPDRFLIARTKTHPLAVPWIVIACAIRWHSHPSC